MHAPRHARSTDHSSGGLQACLLWTWAPEFWRSICAPAHQCGRGEEVEAVGGAMCGCCRACPRNGVRRAAGGTPLLHCAPCRLQPHATACVAADGGRRRRCACSQLGLGANQTMEVGCLHMRGVRADGRSCQASAVCAGQAYVKGGVCACRCQAVLQEKRRAATCTCTPGERERDPPGTSASPKQAHCCA